VLDLRKERNRRILCNGRYFVTKEIFINVHSIPYIMSIYILPIKKAKKRMDMPWSSVCIMHERHRDKKKNRKENEFYDFLG